MYWIEYRPGEKIPQELYYCGYKIDKSKYTRTPLMYWVIHRQNEPIPQELHYDDWQTDKDKSGHTPLMLWIIRGLGESKDHRSP